MTFKTIFLGWSFLTGLIFFPPAAGGTKEIVIAQVAPFSGPVSFYANEVHRGAMAYFSAVNSKGGVLGAKIRLISRDDAFDPNKTVALFQDLHRTEKPVAFIYPIGPANIEALLAQGIPKKLGVPLVGWIPGLYKLRNPVNPFVFHLGLGDDAEVEKLIAHIASIGLKEVGLVYWDERSIRDVILVAEEVALRLNLKISGKIPIAPKGEGDISQAVEMLVKKNPAAVIALLPVNETARLTAELRSRGSRIWIYAPSYNEAGALYRSAGGNLAVGVGLSQVVPNPFDSRRRLIRSYQEDLRKNEGVDVRFSSLSLEGYIAAKVIVEGLIRVGPNPSAVKLRNQLEGLQLDLGDLRFGYSPNQHVGLQYIDIGVVSNGGKLLY